MMKDIDFVTVAKAHADWKIKLRNAIENKEQIDAETLAKDDVCILGKWLHDESTQQNLQNVPAYHNCLKHHAHFHTEAAKIAREINRANYQEASKLLTTGHPYATVSAEVAMDLHELRKAIHN